jgi:hypothetical protein
MDMDSKTENWRCEPCTTREYEYEMPDVPLTVPEAPVKLQRGIKIGHLNVRDLLSRGKKSEIHDLIQRLDFDVFAIGETWLHSEIDNNEISLPGYTTHRSDRPIKRKQEKGGGILIYVKDEWNVETKSTAFTNPTDAVKIQIRKQYVKPINIIALYRPGYTPPLFLDQFEKEILCSKSLQSYFIGDLNYNMKEPITDANSRAIRSLFTQHDFRQLITEPTTHSGSLIDLIIANYPDHNSTSGVITNGISDYHDIVYVVNKKQRFKKIAQTIKARSWKNIDQDSIEQKLSSAPWWSMQYSKNVNKSFELYSSVVKYVLDNYIPIRNITIKYNQPKWLDSNIASMIQYRDKVKRIAKAENNTETWQYYKQLRNLVTVVKEKAKCLFIYDSTKKKRTTKESWKLFNNETGRKSKTPPPKCIIEDSIQYTDTKDIADAFGRFYSNVGEQHQGEPLNELIQAHNRTEPRHPNPLSVIDFTEEEVEIAVRKINPEKPTGSDNIPSKFYKLFPNSLIKPLHQLIRQSLLHSEYPEVLKEAYITPSYKGKGPKNQASSYRPISNLSATAKIIDRLMYTKLSQYFEATGQLIKEQHGFRSDHSTQSALIQLTDQIYSAGDQGEYAGVLFLDFKQAFDFVLRDIVIRKLMKYGIRGRLLAWFYNYLSDRKCRIKIGSTLSENFRLRGCLPQGGQLSSLLFSIFINDLPEHIKSCKSNLYADDSALCNTSKSKDNIISHIQQDTDRTVEWCERNRMKINPDKTKFMIFHPRSSTETESSKCIKIYDTKIETVQIFKYLGVWLDTKLSFNHHFDVVNKKVYGRAQLINRNKKYFTYKDLKSIYDSLVLSVVNYCLPIWGNLCDTRTAKLDSKIIFMASSVLSKQTAKRKEKWNVLEKLNWLSVVERRKVFTCEYVYKHIIKETTLSQSLQHHYKLPPDTRERRKPLNFLQPRTRTKWAQSNFIYKSTQLWNDIPDTIQKAKCIAEFSRNLRENIIQERNDIYTS